VRARAKRRKRTLQTAGVVAGVAVKALKWLWFLGQIPIVQQAFNTTISGDEKLLLPSSSGAAPSWVSNLPFPDPKRLFGEIRVAKPLRNGF
jgi:hypothetical protein